MMAYHGLVSTDGDFRDVDGDGPRRNGGGGDDDDDQNEEEGGEGGGDKKDGTGAENGGGGGGGASAFGGNKRRVRTSEGGGGGPPLKKRRANDGQALALHPSPPSSGGAVSSNASRCAALLRWLVGSYRPFALIHDSGGRKDKDGGSSSNSNTFSAFCRTLNASFRVPSAAGLARLANQKHRDILHAVRQDIDGGECEWFSVSVRRVKMVPTTAASAGGEIPPCRVFYPVQITFCSSQFEKRSYAIEVFEGKADGDNGGDPTTKEEDEEEQTSEYFQAVDAALSGHGLSRERVTNVTVGGGGGGGEGTVRGSVPPDSWVRRLPYPGAPCSVLDQLDGIVTNAIQTHLGDLLTRATEALLLRRDGGGGQDLAAATADDAPPVDLFGSQRAYQTLQHSPRLLGGDLSPLHASGLSKVLAFLLPFRDAMQTLRGDAHPTIGLTIPVLRRIRDVLDEASKGMKRGDPAGGDEGDNEDAKAADLIRDLFETLRGDFASTFATVIGQNPPLMWTMPLDPRLVSMSSLSDEEKELATKTLTNEAKALVKEINKQQHGQQERLEEPSAKDETAKPSDGAAQGDEGNGDTSATQAKGAGSSDTAPAGSAATDTPTASTMGGIFWGEDDAAKYQTEKDKDDYATKNVESYFNTVRSQRRIDDPLLWWKNNQQQFPELAALARKWMGASAVYSGPISSSGDDDKVIKLDYSASLPMKMAIFLHDNQDLI